MCDFVFEYVGLVLLIGCVSEVGGNVDYFVGVYMVFFVSFGWRIILVFISYCVNNNGFSCCGCFL